MSTVRSLNELEGVGRESLVLNIHIIGNPNTHWKRRDPVISPHRNKEAAGRRQQEAGGRRQVPVSNIVEGEFDG